MSTEKLLIYIRYENGWKPIYGVESKEIEEKGRVKDDWPCHMCSMKKCDDLYKVVTDKRFTLVCFSCVRMDYFSFLYGKKAANIIRKYK